MCDIDVEDNVANRIAEPAHEVASNQGHIIFAQWLYLYSGLA